MPARRSSRSPSASATALGHASGALPSSSSSASSSPALVPASDKVLAAIASLPHTARRAMAAVHEALVVVPSALAPRVLGVVQSAVVFLFVGSPVIAAITVTLLLVHSVEALWILAVAVDTPPPAHWSPSPAPSPLAAAAAGGVGDGHRDEKSHSHHHGSATELALASSHYAVLAFWTVYAVWVAADWTTAVSGGTERLRVIRAWSGWTRFWRTYFPVSLVRSAPLPADRNYIFGIHPHGLYCLGAFSNFVAEHALPAAPAPATQLGPAASIHGFRALFPGLRLRLATLKINFALPLWREINLVYGFISVDYRSCKRWLLHGTQAVPHNSPLHHHHARVHAHAADKVSAPSKARAGLRVVTSLFRRVTRSSRVAAHDHHHHETVVHPSQPARDRDRRHDSGVEADMAPAVLRACESTELRSRRASSILNPHMSEEEVALIPLPPSPPTRRLLGGGEFAGDDEDILTDDPIDAVPPPPPPHGAGRVLMICIGGAEESLLARPGRMELVLRKRKGFVRLALDTGSSMVPVVSFGETELFNQYQPAPGSVAHCVQRSMKAAMGWTLPLCYGRFGSWLPFRKPVTTVVGEPIHVPHVPNPPRELVEYFHDVYMRKLTELWHAHVDLYAPPGSTMEIVA
ncbi:diacylglycerol O-acyltransferase 1 [Blastocladiella emersonii ATCC 22665]|nr:diacylglycerol O-acyltransferase 1 [Blastocladiella emersonii ATCC 22665]